MNRIRILIAFCAAIGVLAALATMSSAADKKLYAARMTGGQEKPKGDPNGTGTAVITLKASQICYDIRPKNSGRSFRFGHIHTGVKGKAGPVLIVLWKKTKTISGGKLTGCASAKAADLAKVRAKPGGHYVNIHSGAYPGGVIRAQLTTTKPG